MKYEHFFRRQRSSIATEFSGSAATCLIATTPERLIRHGVEYGWRVEGVPRIRVTNALVVTKPGLDPVLWVNRSYRSYRHAYERFLALHCGGTGQRLPPEWDVDHLQPLHLFNPGSPCYFVRLALLPREINASYGAGVEKLFYGRERRRQLSGGVLMDWLVFLKCQGVRLPGKVAGPEAWQLWAWDTAGHVAGMLKENRVLCYHGISTMLNLGYSSVYAPLHPALHSRSMTAEVHGRF